MAEELLEFDRPVEQGGERWTALVLGEEQGNGTWIGWIRFLDRTGETRLETERESTQPNREDLEYWAGGLTYAYLEGALERARRRSGPSS